MGSRFMVSIILLSCLCLLPVAVARCEGPKTSGDVLKLVLAGYQAQTCPTEWNTTWGPTSVQVYHSIIGVETVNMKEQTVTMGLWSRWIWIDPRLAWNASCFPPGLNIREAKQAFFTGTPKGTIWLPSLFVENARDAPKVIEGGWWIRPDGRVWYSRKEFWKISCTMDFTQMPFDKQTCLARLTAYNENEYLVTLKVREGKSGLAATEDKYRVGGETGWDFGTGGGDHAYVRDGYPVLDMFYKLERKPAYYISTVVQPVMFFVCLAYLSFYISRKAAPARVALVLICYLAISNKVSSVQDNLPEMSDPVWMLRFMFMSTVFVFVAAAEYALANFSDRVEARIAKKVEGMDDLEPGVSFKKQLRNKISRCQYLCLLESGVFLPSGKHLDLFMRYAFILGYVVAVGVFFAEI